MKKITVLLFYLIVASVSAQEMFYNVLDYRARGGASKEFIDKEVPQNIDMYPDPYRWHSMPAYGIYFRYVKGLRVNNVVLRYMNRDERPAFILDDVHDASFNHIYAQKGEDTPQFILKNVSNISIHEVNGVEDAKLEKWKRENFSM